MTQEQNFTKAEIIKSERSSSLILWRFLKSLPLLKYTAAPSLFLAFLASLMAPGFLFVVGKYADNPDAGQGKISLGDHHFVFPVTLKFVAIIAVGAVIVRTLCWVIYECSGLWSTQAFHSTLLKAIAQVRVTYFDEMPSGRLLNRLVGDYGECLL